VPNERAFTEFREEMEIPVPLGFLKRISGRFG